MHDIAHKNGTPTKGSSMHEREKARVKSLPDLKFGTQNSDASTKHTPAGGSAKD